MKFPFDSGASALRGSRQWPLVVPALVMRGGCSKALFVLAADLPPIVERRDALLLRMLGSPDRYGAQLDGLGGATPATSRVVILAPSLRDDCDVDVLYGDVAIDEARIDYSRTCSQLVAAIGPAAIAMGLVEPVDGQCRVRIWQVATSQRVDAFVPVREGLVVEEGEFDEDGVPFGGAEIRLELFARSLPSPGAANLLPTGQVQDSLAVDGLDQPLPVTLIAGPVPVVFVRASALGLSGRESASQFKRQRPAHERLAAVRAAAAQRFEALGIDTGLTAESVGAGLTVVCVERPAAYRASNGVELSADRIDLLARLIVDGRFEPQMPVEVAIALAAAAALPGSLVNELVRLLPSVPTRIGHAGGVQAVGAEVSKARAGWRLDKAVLSRSARRLMSGLVHVPPARISA